MIFKPISDRFFSYHPVVPWDGREPLPATQGTFLRHPGPHLSILRVAAGPVGPYGKPRLRDSYAVFTPILLLSPRSALGWPGTTSSNPRHPPTTLWVTLQHNKVCRGARGAPTGNFDYAIFRPFSLRPLCIIRWKFTRDLIFLQ